MESPELFIYHTSDIHLGATCSGFGDSAGARRKEVRETFRWICRTAAEEGAAAVVVAGDLFDGPCPDEEDLKVVRAAAQSVGDAGGQLVVIPGNHDGVFQPGSVFSRPDIETIIRAAVLTDPTQGPVTLGNPGRSLAIHGWADRPGRSHDPLQDGALTSSADFNMLLLHRQPRGEAFAEGPNVMDFAHEALVSTGVDYVALGDSHQWREVHEAPMAVYSGSPAQCRLHPGELGPRSVARVTFRNSGVEVERISVPGRYAQHIKLDVAGVASEDALWDRIESGVNADAYPYVTLTGDLEFALDVSSIEAQLANDYGAGRLKDRTQFVDSAIVGQWREEDTVRGLFVRRLDEKHQSGELDSGVYQRTLKLGVSLFAGMED